MFIKKSRSFILVILIVVLIVPFIVTPASAAYENTYKNTGNMKNDIIGVALTQVGYREGDNNYTKYGVWFGSPNSSWCGIFVSWCAKEAGIPTSVLKRTGVANPKNFGLSYKSGTEYTPQKGDLFFKKNFSHVGLVYYTDGAYFYTIEGNTSTTSSAGHSVLIRKRKISDFYFSTPNYSGSGSNSGGSTNTSCAHDYTTKVESDHPHKEYKICSKCSSKTYTGVKKADDSCTTCVQAACKHTFTEWKKVNDTKHSRTCSKCELKETAKHNWKDGKVLTEATCMDSGKLQILCSDCGLESTKAVDPTGEHKYTNYTYIDEVNHTKICSFCDKQITAKHTVSSKWHHDSLYHWTSCSDCSGRIRHEEHKHPDGCLSPCAACGYTIENGHELTGKKGSNEASHWDICDRCGITVNEGSHQYTSECDELCNVCNYRRSAAADHQDVYHADDTGHWRECSICNRITNSVSHTADQTADEWENQCCVYCKYVLRSDDKHVHGFDSVESNSTMHWGTCNCGEEIAPEVHSWDFQTGTCSICGVVNTPDKESGNFLIALINRILR